MTNTIDAVRGMRDMLPGEYALQAHVIHRLEQTLASYGYQQLDLPIVEHRDLYVRKLGEELVGKVYEFSFNGRDLALRPEWTASVLRTYVSRMQDQPLPLRLRYAGPVFRNERPQRGTYRQFTQVGVELLGAAAPRADAEVVALACAGLDSLGIHDYRVRIGHIGLLRAVLSRFELNDRTRDMLVWSMEHIRQRGISAVSQTIFEEDDAPLLDPALLEGLSDTQAEALLRRALETIGVNLQFGTRPPEAIVARLVRKLRHTTPRANIDHALALLERLAPLAGPLEPTLAAAEALFAEFEIVAPELEELRNILTTITAHGVAPEQLIVDFGIGRGLHYYTGMIFEIFDAHELQLCGGGRYDDLVTTLGGRQAVPAVGCAYGVERVVAARTHTDSLPTVPEVLVMSIDDQSYRYALEVAQILRNQGYVASIDIRGRSMNNNMRDAARRGAILAVVGAEEQQHQLVRWRQAGKAEERIRLADLPVVPTS